MRGPPEPSTPEAQDTERRYHKHARVSHFGGAPALHHHQLCHQRAQVRRPPRLVPPVSQIDVVPGRQHPHLVPKLSQDPPQLLGSLTIARPSFTRYSIQSAVVGFSGRCSLTSSMSRGFRGPSSAHERCMRVLSMSLI